MTALPIAPLSDTDWLLLTTPDDTEEAPWMTMPDFQWRVIAMLVSILRRHAHQNGLRWYIAAELKVTMPRAITPRVLDLGPDLLMAEADDRERTSWNVAQEEQPPQFVLEVVTEESWERDSVEKPHLYQRMGVQEYAIFAPLRTDGGPLLFGYHRTATGRWLPWPTDRHGALHSRALGHLRLYVEGNKWLRARDSRGTRLLSDGEAAEHAVAQAEQAAARTAREAARAEREAARAEREAARAEQEAARAEREAARADVAEAKLRRLQALYGTVEEDIED